MVIRAAASAAPGSAARRRSPVRNGHRAGTV